MEMNMAKISAVINTRNEETNIRACLESVKWCDEIIVVDMESEDRTVEIAKEFTDKIYTHKKILAFDGAKQFAVDKASYDWVLQLDADERVPKKLAILLRSIADTNPRADVYRLPRKNYLLGRWIKYGWWHPDSPHRFFKKGHLVFTDEIHNFYRPEGIVETLKVKDDEYIVHFNYYDSQHFIHKMNSYTSIEAQQHIDNKMYFKKRHLIIKPVGAFIKSYVLTGGYKDGIFGLMLSVYLAFYRFLTIAKYFEIVTGLDSRRTYKEIEDEILKEYSKRPGP
jgi:glycosyltransferase involved in cell wall biosynthesis